MESSVTPIYDNNSHQTDRNNTAERLQTEYNENEDTELQFLSSNELKRWLHLSIIYFFTFMLLILWSYNYMPIQISLFPLILGDIKIIFSSGSQLKTCER